MSRNATEKQFHNLKYSQLSQAEPVESTSSADVDPDDWQYNYRSAFTYAAVNDLDHMGYQAPPRYATPRGPRYADYTYRAFDEEKPVVHMSAAVHINALEKIIVGFSYLLIFLTLPISLLFSLKFVGACECLVVLRLGRAQKLQGPRTAVILPCIDSYTRLDLRINAFHVPPMQVITVDQGLVELGATIFFKIKDAIAAVCAIRERNQSTRTLAITVLHRLVCRERVCELTTGYGSAELAAALKGELCETTLPWGIEIVEVELSEIKVLKEAENIALATFTKVMKSDFGTELLKSLESAMHSFVTKTDSEKTDDLIDLSENGRNADSTNRDNQGKCSQNQASTSGLQHQSDMSAVSSDKESTIDEKKFDLDQLLGLITMVTDEHLVALVGHVFQIQCTDVGDFYIDLKNGRGSCGRGKRPNADVTFQLSRDAFLRFLSKKLSPFQAYMDGTVKITGSKKAAVKLSYLSERLVHLL